MNIKLNDWYKYIDEFNAFMLGIDDAVEKTIIRYLYEKNDWISHKELKEFAVNKSMICWNEATLSRRLTSLTNFKIIDRKYENKHFTFYKLNDTFIKELREKKEAKY